MQTAGAAELDTSKPSGKLKCRYVTTRYMNIFISASLLQTVKVKTNMAGARVVLLRNLAREWPRICRPMTFCARNCCKWKQRSLYCWSRFNQGALLSGQELARVNSGTGKYLHTRCYIGMVLLTVRARKAYPLKPRLGLISMPVWCRFISRNGSGLYNVLGGITSSKDTRAAW